MFTILAVLAIAACGTTGGADTASGDTSTAGSGLTAEDCTSEQVFANVCTRCGPTDACTERQDLCLTTCTTEQEWQACADGGTCMDGVCYPAICG